MQWQDGQARLSLEVWYGLGASPVPFKETFSFKTVGTCNEGELTRITCSVVERGVAGGIVCSALYEDMVDPNKVPDQCRGTYACARCGTVKVCGSNPQCY